MIALLLAACGTDAPAPAAGTAGASGETVSVGTPAPLPERYGLGTPATPDEIAAWDRDVDPSWNGLPDGKGTVAEGRALYAVKCLMCHGPDAKGGQGWLGPNLVSPEPTSNFGADYHPPRTVGNYWPYASTVFDYIYRSMPQTAPASLTPDETYALVAFVLAENQILPADGSLDQDSIKKVVMPVKDKFVEDDRLGTTSFR